MKKKLIFKTFTPFACCISKINVTPVDKAKDLDGVMPMCIVAIVKEHREFFGIIAKVNQL